MGVAVDDDVILIKPLEGWLTLEEAEGILGLTKQGVHAMVWRALEFDFDRDVRAVGRRPTYVLRESAVLKKKEERDKAAAARAARAAMKAETKDRVRRRGVAARPN